MASEYDSDESYIEDSDEDVNDYYNNNEFEENFATQTNVISTYTQNERKKLDELEDFTYSCLTYDEVQVKLNKASVEVVDVLNISKEFAKLVLMKHSWNFEEIKSRVSKGEKEKVLVESGIKLSNPAKRDAKKSLECPICFDEKPEEELFSLNCKHLFCRCCWTGYLEYSPINNYSLGITCMETNCSLLCSEDFLTTILADHKAEVVLANVNKMFRRASVETHFQLRYCPGPSCEIVVYAQTPKARQVKCTKCKTSFCYECGNPYHLPCSCETIRKWLKKCFDDSETSNYISANTKECPSCNTCIEKNGGCNHIQCTKCGYHFCWVCQQDWKTHGNSYYQCSTYKENKEPESVQDHQSKARLELERYLFYFQRWNNHDQSLRMEEKAHAKIQKLVEHKVNQEKVGTWIDWQYLITASKLLAKCRYTLQYTYPFAYHGVGDSDEMSLFEHQQAQLEAEIEELAWKLEHNDFHQRGAIENQMDVAEKRRVTLLTRFFNH